MFVHIIVCVNGKKTETKKEIGLLEREKVGKRSVFDKFIEKWENKTFSTQDKQVIIANMKLAYNRLTDLEKTCFRLRYEENLKQEQIAKRLNLYQQKVCRELRKAEDEMLSEMRDGIQICEVLKNEKKYTQ